MGSSARLGAVRRRGAAMQQNVLWSDGCGAFPVSDGCPPQASHARQPDHRFL